MRQGKDAPRRPFFLVEAIMGVRCIHVIRLSRGDIPSPLGYGDILAAEGRHVNASEDREPGCVHEAHVESCLGTNARNTLRGRIVMNTNTKHRIAAVCLLSAIACSALAAGPVYDVTCLDCSLDLTLVPLGINSSGVVVATDGGYCSFPTRCRDGQGYVIDHGTVTMTPSFDGASSAAMAINDSNVVVGKSSMPEYPQGPFGYSWDGTTMINLGDSINQTGEGPYFSQAMAINNPGHIVGLANYGYHDIEAFHYRNGRMTVVPRLDGAIIDIRYSLIRINGKNHIVGTSLDGRDDMHRAWISKNGITQDLAPGSWSEAYAINDADQVVGLVRVGTDVHYRHDWPVIWKEGTTTLLNTLHAFNDNGQANAINNGGWVVGDACGFTVCTAFVFNGRKMFNLNNRLSASSTGWKLLHATGINDSGVIVGTGELYNAYHAFMATPVQPAIAR